MRWQYLFLLQIQHVLLLNNDFEKTWVDDNLCTFFCWGGVCQTPQGKIKYLNVILRRFYLFIVNFRDYIYYFFDNSYLWTWFASYQITNEPAYCSDVVNFYVNRRIKDNLLNLGQNIQLEYLVAELFVFTSYIP